MQIVCATTAAAAQVLWILRSTGLCIALDFTIRPGLSTTPPFTFAMLGILTAVQVTKIRAVADTTIVG